MTLQTYAIISRDIKSYEQGTSISIDGEQSSILRLNVQKLQNIVI